VPELPSLPSEIKKYADRYVPKKDKDMWIKMHIGYTNRIEDLISGQDSNNADWFDDNESQGFYCMVQDSDDAVPLGDLLYSGQFIDHVRLKDQIEKQIAAYGKGPFSFGCRPKRQNEITQVDRPRNWTMADNQPIHIECDRKDSKALKPVLYHLFNKTNDRYKRPGGYNLRLLPDSSIIRSGPDGQKLRVRTFRKHQGVINSLQLISTYDIARMDSPFAQNGTSYTLREFINTFTYPLKPEPDDKTQPLFHSVDWATKGADANSAVYATAYHDRAGLASDLLGILPALVTQFISRRATKEWFHQTAIDACNGVSFDTDETGEWTGNWTTEEDVFQKELIDEDMGIDLQLEGMEILQTQEEFNVTTTDDHSLKTWSSVFVGKPTDNDSQSQVSTNSRQEIEAITQPGDGSVA
jgi:hypothetical protein